MRLLGSNRGEELQEEASNIGHIASNDQDRAPSLTQCCTQKGRLDKVDHGGDLLTSSTEARAPYYLIASWRSPGGLRTPDIGRTGNLSNTS